VRRLGEPDQVGKVEFSNVKQDILSDELRELFNNYGAVQEISLRYDRAGRSTGEGFVRFATMDIARKCVADLDQAEVEGQAIKLKVISSAPLQRTRQSKLRMDEERPAPQAAGGHSRTKQQQGRGSNVTPKSANGANRAQATKGNRAGKHEPSFVVRLDGFTGAAEGPGARKSDSRRGRGGRQTGGRRGGRR
jgi:THO complex subunit 4